MSYMRLQMLLPIFFVESSAMLRQACTVRKPYLVDNAEVFNTIC